jgi:hypothetical protein
MLAPKIITFFAGLLLLLPFAITFWIMAFRNEDTEEDLKKRHAQAMAELKAEFDSNRDPDETAEDSGSVMMGVQVYESMCLPMVSPDIWSFFPRRWVGIVGLICVFTMSGLWLLSSFVPSLTYSGEYIPTPPPESTSAPANTQK